MSGGITLVARNNMTYRCLVGDLDHLLILCIRRLRDEDNLCNLEAKILAALELVENA